MSGDAGWLGTGSGSASPAPVAPKLPVGSLSNYRAAVAEAAKNAIVRKRSRTRRLADAFSAVAFNPSRTLTRTYA